MTDKVREVAPVNRKANVTRVQQEVEIAAGNVRLGGTLVLPPESEAVVLFAHGSGSSRFSPRNTFVAQELHNAGLGTLLFDLLEEPEAQDRRRVFDIELLASRLRDGTQWLRAQPAARGLRFGYFGASTGAAAALQAAALEGQGIGAVVSRGGRPDLAGPYLREVLAPTLLIVGGEDRLVLKLNEEALEELRCDKELVVIPGATHLFEEPGALEQVADFAAQWFKRYLMAPAVQS